MLRTVGMVSVGLRGNHQEMGIMHQETRKGLHEVRPEILDLRRHMGRLDSEIGDLRVRVAYLEGVLSVLRKVLVQRTGSELSSRS